MSGNTNSSEITGHPLALFTCIFGDVADCHLAIDFYFLRLMTKTGVDNHILEPFW